MSNKRSNKGSPIKPAVGLEACHKRLSFMINRFVLGVAKNEVIEVLTDKKDSANPYGPEFYEKLNAGFKVCLRLVFLGPDDELPPDSYPDGIGDALCLDIGVDPGHFAVMNASGEGPEQQNRTTEPDTDPGNKGLDSRKG